MVNAGLALFECSPLYKKFSMNTVDALGRAWHSWHPQGPFAGSADGCRGPWFIENSNHCDESDSYECELHHLEDGIHYWNQMAIWPDGYDSVYSEGHIYIVSDGEAEGTFQHHLEKDEIKIQPRFGGPADTDIINPVDLC